MNKRIKELMGKTLDDKFSHTWDTMTHEGLLQFSEKFAELIVQRTLEIVDAHTEIFQSFEARAMVEHIKHSVKTDFGVEE